MGVITVSIDDKVEERFREELEKRGNRKGRMGELVSEAIRSWLENEDKPRWMEIAEEGIPLGDIEFDREEAHER